MDTGAHAYFLTAAPDLETENFVLPAGSCPGQVRITNRSTARVGAVLTNFALAAKFTWLVLSCIEAKFCKEKLNTRLKALAEIYTTHSFAQLCNLIFNGHVFDNFAKFSKS